MVNRREFLIGSLAGTAGLVGGLLVPAIGSASDEPTAVDAGFCTDMSVHHLQALAMCQRVLGRDTGDPVQAAAAEVLQNQSIEVGQMRAWLTDWGRPTTTPDLVMGWMGANDGTGMPVEMMPGLASDDEMRELSELTGLDQGRRWLELMRAHHEGGVAMATAASELASSPKVIRIASTQAETQAFEIAQYDHLLATAYA